MVLANRSGPRRRYRRQVRLLHRCYIREEGPAGAGIAGTAAGAEDRTAASRFGTEDWGCRSGRGCHRQQGSGGVGGALRPGRRPLNRPGSVRTRDHRLCGTLAYPTMLTCNPEQRGRPERPDDLVGDWTHFAGHVQARRRRRAPMSGCVSQDQPVDAGVRPTRLAREHLHERRHQLGSGVVEPGIGAEIDTTSFRIRRWCSGSPMTLHYWYPS